MVTCSVLDPETHKRYLDYRERYGYFVKQGQGAMLGPVEFAAADKEQRALDAIGEGQRDDEEEARYEELSRILLRD